MLTFPALLYHVQEHKIEIVINQGSLYIAVHFWPQALNFCSDSGPWKQRLPDRAPPQTMLVSQYIKFYLSTHSSLTVATSLLGGRVVVTFLERLAWVHFVRPVCTSLSRTGKCEGNRTRYLFFMYDWWEKIICIQVEIQKVFFNLDEKMCSSNLHVIR